MASKLFIMCLMMAIARCTGINLASTGIPPATESIAPFEPTKNLLTSAPISTSTSKKSPSETSTEERKTSTPNDTIIQATPARSMPGITQTPTPVAIIEGQYGAIPKITIEVFIGNDPLPPESQITPLPDMATLEICVSLPGYWQERRSVTLTDRTGQRMTWYPISVSYQYFGENMALQIMWCQWAAVPPEEKEFVYTIEGFPSVVLQR